MEKNAFAVTSSAARNASTSAAPNAPNARNASTNASTSASPNARNASTSAGPSVFSLDPIKNGLVTRLEERDEELWKKLRSLSKSCQSLASTFPGRNAQISKIRQFYECFFNDINSLRQGNPPNDTSFIKPISITLTKNTITKISPLVIKVPIVSKVNDTELIASLIFSIAFDNLFHMKQFSTHLNYSHKEAGFHIPLVHIAIEGLDVLDVLIFSNTEIPNRDADVLALHKKSWHYVIFFLQYMEQMLKEPGEWFTRFVDRTSQANYLKVQQKSILEAEISKNQQACELFISLIQENEDYKSMFPTVQQGMDGGRIRSRKPLRYEDRTKADLLELARKRNCKQVNHKTKKGDIIQILRNRNK